MPNVPQQPTGASVIPATGEQPAVVQRFRMVVSFDAQTKTFQYPTGNRIESHADIIIVEVMLVTTNDPGAGRNNDPDEIAIFADQPLSFVGKSDRRGGTVLPETVTEFRGFSVVRKADTRCSIVNINTTGTGEEPEYHFYLSVFWGGTFSASGDPVIAPKKRPDVEPERPQGPGPGAGTGPGAAPVQRSRTEGWLVGLWRRLFAHWAPA